MGIKETVMNSMYRGMECDANREEPPVIKIASLARASQLGRALWHLAAGQHVSTAIPLLVREMRRNDKANYDLCVRIAKQALFEHLYPACRTCGGETQIMVDQRKVECPTCATSGVHRFSDDERATAIGESMTMAISKRLRQAIEIIAEHDMATRRIVSTELER